jgi:hypothetical protein
MNSFFLSFKKKIEVISSEYYQRISVIIFFIMVLTVGLICYPDYGISFDEPVSRDNGGISLKYVLKKFDSSILANDVELNKLTIPLQDYRDRDYGVVFDLPLFFIERLFGVDDSRQQYLLRHLCTYLLFFLSVIALYKAAIIRSGSRISGLIAAGMLFFSPRLFAEAFYNNKDMVFLSCSAIFLLAITHFIKSPTIIRAILLGAITGLAIDVRITGVVFVAISLIVLTGLAFVKILSIKNYIYVSISYLSTSMLVTYACWPWLWENPVGHFLIAFKNMAHFRWDNYNLYLGSYIKATALPWHYSLVWIGFTIPLVYLFYFLIGSIKVSYLVCKDRLQIFKNQRHTQDLTFWLCAVTPLCATIVLQSTLYDGWRQLYFIYPAIVLLAVSVVPSVLRQVAHRRMLHGTLALSIPLQFTACLVWMVYYHPHQNVYFNQLAQTQLEKKFEVDYWGLTNYDCLRYLLLKDPRQRIRVAGLGATSLQQSTQLLSRADRSRIELSSEVESADYLITNHRFFDGQTASPPMPRWRELHKIVIDGRVVATIYE